MDGLGSPGFYFDTACRDTASFSDTSIWDRISFSAGEPVFHSGGIIFISNTKEISPKSKPHVLYILSICTCICQFCENISHLGGIFDSSGSLSFEVRLSAPVLKVQLSQRRIALSSIMFILGRTSTLC